MVVAGILMLMHCHVYHALSARDTPISPVNGGRSDCRCQAPFVIPGSV